MRIVQIAMIILAITSNVCAQTIDNKIANAEAHLDKSNYDQAALDFKQIISSHSSQLSELQKGNIYNNLGFVYLKLFEPQTAENYLELAITSHEKLSPRNYRDYAAVLQNLGVLYLEMADFDLAKSYIEQSLKALENANSSELEMAIARTKLALLYEETGYFNLALEIYQECYNSLLEKGVQLSPDFAETCSHMGRILIRNGKIKEAEDYINQSTTIYEQLGKDYDVQRAESLESLALFYEQIGRYGEAEGILLESLEIKKTIPYESDILIIETLNDLGILYDNLGNFAKAQDMFNQVIEKCEQTVGITHQFYATAKNNLATIAIREGRFDEAKEMLLAALKSYQNLYGNDHPLCANTMNNLARVERSLGNYQMAESYYLQVLTIDEKFFGRKHPDYATTLINIGVMYSSMGREMEAESFYLESLDIRKEVLGENHPEYGNALDHLGLHSMALGNEVKAEEYFRKAIEIQIKQITSVFPVLTESEREAFYQSMRQDIDRYNYVAFNLLGENPELVKTIFDFRIKTKSILFSASNRLRTSIQNSSDDELRNLYRKWQSGKKLLANYYQMGVKQLQDHHINLQESEEEIERLEKDLVRKASEFKDILSQENENWQSVCEVISSDEAVVEIVRIKEFKTVNDDGKPIFGFTDFTQYLAIIFLPQQNEPEYVVLGSEYRTENDHYTKYKNSMLYNTAQSSTFESFWKPIHEKVKNVSRVKLSPDGIFYKMNPNSFKITDNDFVLDKYYVSYLTSCKDLFLEKQNIHLQKAYLFGNPSFSKTEGNGGQLSSLPGTEAEVTTITSLLSPSDWRVKSYLSGEASELKLRSAYNPTILHIATHGFFSDNGNFISSISPIRDPLFKSGLFLSGASDTYSSFLKGIPTTNSNDGILTAYEAMNLNLNQTQLVVLSACETGLGDVRNGEGVFGLQRAFMVAGARNVITSIFKIGDQTTNELMVLFYEKFIETGRADESLMYAQRKLKETYADAKTWGAFILTGNQ
ncbi:MAG: tetratricopeptide repeat protein [Ekhidna sp.]